MSEKIEFELDPYLYKKLDAESFIDYARRKIANSSNCIWITDDVVNVTSGEKVEVNGNEGNYWAGHVFDSRVDARFHQEGDHIKVWSIS
ncbi:MAG: hypothetical protein HKN87_13590 [Saprospiraceae bacterium]|nr:hypothetical protein [Saprospiraceae bacterium]